MEWARQCMDGTEDAIHQLQSILKNKAAYILQQRGATQSQAGDLIQDLLGDCVARSKGKPSILERYDGRLSLENWLLMILTRRWIDQRRKHWRFDEASVEDHPDIPAPPNTCSAEMDFPALLSTLLSHTVRELDTASRITLKLIYLHGVPQNKAAILLGWHTSKVSRQLRDTIDHVRHKVLAELQRIDPDMEWNWRELLEFHREGLLGLWESSQNK